MNTLFKLIALFFILMTPIELTGKDRIIPYEKLPVAAKEFISQYFSDAKPIQTTYELNEYEVRFDDMSTIEFNHKGRCKEIDLKNKPVPEELVLVKYKVL